MPRMCIVGGCRKTNAHGVSLFIWPRDLDIGQKWIDFVCTTREWSETAAGALDKATVLCSDHFTQDCFDQSNEMKFTMGFGRIKRRLRDRFCVPTIPPSEVADYQQQLCMDQTSGQDPASPGQEEEESSRDAIQEQSSNMDPTGIHTQSLMTDPVRSPVEVANSGSPSVEPVGAELSERLSTDSHEPNAEPSEANNMEQTTDSQKSKGSEPMDDSGSTDKGLDSDPGESEPVTPKPKVKPGPLSSKPVNVREQLRSEADEELPGSPRSPRTTAEGLPGSPGSGADPDVVEEDGEEMEEVKGSRKRQTTNVINSDEDTSDVPAKPALHKDSVVKALPGPVSLQIIKYEGPAGGKEKDGKGKDTDVDLTCTETVDYSAISVDPKGSGTINISASTKEALRRSITNKDKPSVALPPHLQLPYVQITKMDTIPEGYIPVSSLTHPPPIPTIPNKRRRREKTTPKRRAAAVKPKKTSPKNAHMSPGAKLTYVAPVDVHNVKGVKWQKHVLDKLNKMRHKGELTDFTIKARESKGTKMTTLHVHSIVIAAASPVLYNVILTSKNHVYNNDQINAQTWRTLLTYIYTGSGKEKLCGAEVLTAIKMLQLGCSPQSVDDSLSSNDTVTLQFTNVNVKKEPGAQDDSLRSFLPEEAGISGYNPNIKIKEEPISHVITTADDQGPSDIQWLSDFEEEVESEEEEEDEEDDVGFDDQWNPRKRSLRRGKKRKKKEKLSKGKHKIGGKNLKLDPEYPDSQEDDGNVAKVVGGRKIKPKDPDFMPVGEKDDDVSNDTDDSDDGECNWVIDETGFDENTEGDNKNDSEGFEWRGLQANVDPDKPRLCYICGEDFLNEAKYIEHAKEKHVGTENMCPICYVWFTSKTQSKSHIKKCRYDRQCSVCEEVFVSRLSLMKHMYTAHERCPYRCSTCNIRFPTTSAARYHFNTKHKEKKVPKKKYNTKKNKKKKGKKVSENKEETEMGEKVEENKEETEKGEAQGGTEKGEGKKKKGKGGYKWQRKWKCPTCPYQTKSRGNLDDHIWSMHKDKNNPNKNLASKKCEVCAMEFNSYSNLKIHQSRVHTTERPVVCDICGKTFKVVNDLNKHKQLHTGIKKWPCTFCNRSFARHCYLKQHERLHTGERPYTCDKCGEGFAQKNSLNWHMKKHEGGRSYESTPRKPKAPRAGYINPIDTETQRAINAVTTEMRADMRAGDSTPGACRFDDSISSDPRFTDSRSSEPRFSESRSAEPRFSDSRYLDLGMNSTPRLPDQARLPDQPTDLRFNDRISEPQIPHRMNEPPRFPDRLGEQRFNDSLDPRFNQGALDQRNNVEQRNNLEQRNSLDQRNNDGIDPTSLSSLYPNFFIPQYFHM